MCIVKIEDIRTSARFRIFQFPRHSEPHIIGGYKMRLSVCIGKTYMSVALSLMKGEHDDHNQWPFCKPVSFRIIHPNDNNRYYKKTLTRHLSNSKEFPGFQKPVQSDYGIEHGFDNFITVEELHEGGYVKHETLVLSCELRF